MAVKTINETTEIKVLSTLLALAPTANSLDVVFVAPTVASDGVEFKQLGTEVVLVQNSDAANPYTFTLKSVASSALLNRTGDIGPYTLQAGEIAAILINNKGFASATGFITVVMENIAVKVGVIRVPAQVS